MVIAGAAIYWLRGILTPLALAIFLMVMIDSFVRVLKGRAPFLPRWAVALLRRAGDLAIRQQPSRFHPPVLSAEPALARQEGGDHVAFELRQVMRPEEIGPAPRHDQRDALR